MSKELNDKFLNAVMTDDVELMIEALKEGADLNAVTDSGNNALFLAISKRKTNAFETLLLLEVRGETINLNHQNLDGETALFLCIKDLKSLSYLDKLIEAGADVNIPDREGMSPLIKAIAFSKFEDIKSILNAPNIDIHYEIPGSKTTAFIMATTALKGDEVKEVINLLLENGANINSLDTSGKNALINCIYRGTAGMTKEEEKQNTELCLHLINLGIDIDHVSDSGMTAFWAASKVGDVEVVDLLLEKNVKTEVSHKMGLEESTSALTYWINKYRGDEVDKNRIKKIIQLGADINHVNDDLNTPASAGFANPFARDLMLELNADVNTILHTIGENNEVIKLSALEMVVAGGDKQINVVQEMISKGANVTYENTNESLREPIFNAVSSRALNVFAALLATNKINPNVVLKANTYFNKSQEDISLLSFLLSDVVDKRLAGVLEQENTYNLILQGHEINKQNNVKSELIDDAGIEEIKEKLDAIINLKEVLLEKKKGMFDLLTTYNVDVNMKSNKGNTALFLINDVVSAKWLIDAGADIFIENNDGDNILISALKKGKLSLVKEFRDLYRENKPELSERLYYDIAFSDNKSHLISSNIVKGLSALLTPEELEKITPDPKSGEAETLDNISEVHYRDINGNTPLMVACAKDNTYLVSMYMRLGADVNATNNLGETPLMHAISTYNAELVRFLIDNKADVNAVANNGRSISDFAEETKDKEIIEKVKVALNLMNEGTLTKDIKKIKPI